MEKYSWILMLFFEFLVVLEGSNIFGLFILLRVWIFYFVKKSMNWVLEFFYGWRNFGLIMVNDLFFV